MQGVSALTGWVVDTYIATQLLATIQLRTPVDSQLGRGAHELGTRIDDNQPLEALQSDTGAHCTCVDSDKDCLESCPEEFGLVESSGTMQTHCSPEYKLCTNPLAL